MAKKDGGVQRAKPSKKAPQAATTATTTATATATTKAGEGAGDAVLWEEIQKLGGGMDDLNLLQDIDTGKSGKSATKTQKVDEKALMGDLSAFAKSLGLATSIPDFVGLSGSEKKKIGSKDKPKRDDDAKPSKVDDKKAPIPNDKKPEAPSKKVADKKQQSKEARASKSDSVAAGDKPKVAAVASVVAAPASAAKEKKKKKLGSDSKAASTPEDVVDIPGFKVKSAKDSLPLPKAGGKLTIEPMSQWFSVALGALETDEGAAKPTEDEVLQKSAFAEQLLDSENSLYDKRGASKKSLSTSDRSFVSNILTS
ncbi:hypothetical protein GGF42_006738, partial [Coemansia sp. RSA 2424]